MPFRSAEAKTAEDVEALHVRSLDGLAQTVNAGAIIG